MAEQYDTEAFLISAANEMEASLLISKLNAYDIPVRKKYRESGDYLSIYMGSTPFGLDLNVPSKLLEKAREIITTPEVADNDRYFPGETDENNVWQDDGQDSGSMGCEDDRELGSTSDEAGMETEDLSDYNEAFQKKRRIRAWLVILIFFPGLLAILLLLFLLLTKLL